MENATKALLIAAAVLVAILIISLGIVVYQMAAETMDSVNFSSQEITAFNDKFMHYNGNNVRGSEVNAMLKTVLNSNMQSRTEGLNPATDAKFVVVKNNTTTVLDKTATSIGTTVNTSKTYTVTVKMDAKTGFVNEINYTETTS